MFGDKLAILGFPCNQFGHQENATNEEILNSLKYVRPGNGYEPKFDMFSKVQVNGSDAHPVFAYLREKLPIPADSENAFLIMNDPKCVIWSPVTRTDIAWNFEKFLIGPDGQPIKRFSRYFQTIDIKNDIEALLK
eukprot:XP_002591986.1 hypothetical protein BRAFLDRAFT_114533 [Branchiostoma floridae]